MSLDIYLGMVSVLSLLCQQRGAHCYKSRDVHETLRSRDRDETRPLKKQVETRRDVTPKVARRDETEAFVDIGRDETRRDVHPKVTRPRRDRDI